MSFDLTHFNPLTADTATKEAAQTELKVEGYYNGNIDGLFYAVSDSAWERWLKDHAAAAVAPGGLLSLPGWYPSDSSKVFVDLYHGNNGFNAKDFKANGGEFAVLKATQDAEDKDPAFEERRADCIENALPWASYHFTGPSNFADQFANYWGVITKGGRAPGIGALDWEDSNSAGTLPNMTPAAASGFVQAFHASAGYWPLLYGNNLIREGVGFVHVHPYFRFCPLWLCDIRKMYRDVPLKTWPNGPAFWQFGWSADGTDLNRFRGTGQTFLAAYANKFQIDSLSIPPIAVPATAA